MERKFKKLFSVIISYVLIFSMTFSSLAVVAADTPQYSIENQTVNAGETFTVDVNLENATDVFGGNFTLQYDTDLLEVSEYTFGDILSNHTKNCNLDYQSAGDLIRFTFSGSEAVGTDGVVLSLTFTAKEETEDVAELIFNSYKLYGTAGTALSGSAVGAEIAIEMPVSEVELELDVAQTGNLSTDVTENVYKFTPTESIGYKVVISNCDSAINCVVKTSNGTVQSTYEDFTEFVEFMSAGETYYFVVSSSAEETVSYDITIKSTPKLTIGLATRTPYSGETCYKFIPEETGTYKFYAESSMGTYAKIYNSDFELVASQELSLYVDYEIVVVLNAGETYTLCVGADVRETSNFYVYAKQLIGEPTSIEITNGDVITGNVGWNSGLRVTILPEDCIVGDVTWTSSDESVVTVDNNGSIHYVGVGTATVTVALENGLSDSITVRVVEVIEIAVGDTIERTITEGDTELVFEFTPTESGTYKFYSAGELNTYAYFHDSNTGTNINANRGGEGENFAITYDFVAGTTYSFKVTVFDIGDVAFVMEEAQSLSKLEIESYPTHMTYYEGLNNYYNLDGLQLKLTFEDGTVGYWTYGIDEAYQGYQVVIKQDDANVVIFCGNKTVNFSFELIESPVESIELVSRKNLELIENVDGWLSGDIFIYEYNIWDVEIQINYEDGTSVTEYVGKEVNGYVINYEDNQWETPFTLGSNNFIVVTYAGKSVNVPVTIVENPIEKMELVTAPSHVYIAGDEKYGYTDSDGSYELYPTNFDGCSFKLYYKDGTEKTYTSDDMEQEFWYIEGRSYDIIFDSDNWVIGENTVTFEYMNHSIDYTILVQESTVASIEVVKAPAMTEYEERYQPMFEGMQVKITYTDDTSKIVEVTEENINYVSDAYEYCSVEIGEHEMLILEDWNYDTSTYEWMVRYLGAEDSCTDITIVENREIESIDISGSYLTGEDVVLDVTYADGTQEQLQLDFVFGVAGEWCPFYGIALTENGITYYSVETDVDNNGEILGYYVYVLDEEVYIPIEEEPDVVTDANIVVSSATTNQGKQVKVTLSLENNPGIISARLNVHYDSSVMTLVGIEDKGNLGATMHSNQFTNPYVLSWANDTILENITFNGDIVTLVFDVTEDAPLGEYVVSVSYDYDNYDICNFDQEKVKFNVVDGVVSIVDTIIGDVNGDGAVNTLDRIALARYLANWEGYTADTIDMTAADVNGDGAVNTLDRIALARHLANWEGYEELPYTN